MAELSAENERNGEADFENTLSAFASSEAKKTNLQHILVWA